MSQSGASGKKRPARSDWQIIVAGAGLAGSIFGGVAARAGYAVLLVERSDRFRDRIRGEVLHSWGVREARALNVEHLFASARAMEIERYQLYHDRAPTLQPHEGLIGGPSGDPPPMLGFSHPSLQESALEWALSEGAELLRPASVVGVSPGPNPEVTVRSDGAIRHIRGRLIVGAGGATSTMRRLTGGGSLADPDHHRIGGGLIEGGRIESNVFHRASGPGVATWVFARQPGQYRIFIVSAPEVIAAHGLDRSPEHFLRYVEQQFPPGMLDGGVQAGPFGFFSNAESWPTRIAGEGVVLIGDAAGRSDPSRGHGTSLLIRDAASLIELLSETEHWQRAVVEFERRRRRAFAPIRALTTWEALINYESGPEADRRRERFARAREADPSLGGFLDLEATGPDGLEVTEEARRHFFGEDLL